MKYFDKELRETFEEFDHLLGDEPAIDDDEFKEDLKFCDECHFSDFSEHICSCDICDKSWCEICDKGHEFEGLSRYDKWWPGVSKDQKICPRCWMSKFGSMEGWNSIKPSVWSESAGNYSEFDGLLGDEPAIDNDEFNILRCTQCHSELNHNNQKVLCGTCGNDYCNGCDSKCINGISCPYCSQEYEYNLEESADYSEFDGLLGDEPADDDDEFVDDIEKARCDICRTDYHISELVMCDNCNRIWCDSCDSKLVRPGVISTKHGDICSVCWNDQFGSLDGWDHRSDVAGNLEESINYSEFDDLLGDEPAIDNDEFGKNKCGQCGERSSASLPQCPMCNTLICHNCAYNCDYCQHKVCDDCSTDSPSGIICNDCRFERYGNG